MIAFLAVFLFVFPVSAELILDQSQESNAGGGAARVYSARDLCQTFTCGTDGYLEKVSIHFSNLVSNLAPATVSIVGTVDGAPNDANVLWTGEYASLAQGWFDVDTSTSSPLLASGTVYGIKLTSSDAVSGDPDNNWDGCFSTDVYSPGKFWEKRSGGAWQSLSISGTSYPDADAMFRTYISPVPEPSTIVLLFGAIFGALLCRKK
jgi:hypothetical protein